MQGLPVCLVQELNINSVMGCIGCSKRVCLFFVIYYCKFRKDHVSFIFACFFLRLASDAKLKFGMISAATLNV